MTGAVKRFHFDGTALNPSIALLRLAALGGIEIDRGRRDSPCHGDLCFAAVILVEFVMVPTVPKQDGIVDIEVEFSGRVHATA